MITNQPGDDGGGMNPHNDGDWVKWKDVQALYEKVCEWKLKHNKWREFGSTVWEGTYLVGCNNESVHGNDNFKFCPYCGGKIKVKE